ncbi:MAG: rRNA pseudouridine synthase [Chlorobium phaeobacteroides]|uniref:Pseudouridine synthase n=1 Tax=Chlorobium phaeobacteroides (strain BS1) TaxID=331678 RepID=B3EM63_CHLPB|nr:rRNA pseudouridine synthase [Chlorobium phaeobacteroides]
MKKKSSNAHVETPGAAVRINKYLALCGIASRRAADRLVESGEVMVNGRIMMKKGATVRPGVDEVVVSNRLLALPEEKKVYILLNKPRNYITTSSDEKERETVLDLVDVRERVFPVGRLDRKTTGMLLLTNDGALAHRLMHPSSEVEKEYLAELETPFSEKDLPSLTGGMRLKDTGEKTSPCKGKIMQGGLRVLVTIHEGKNHQVRRMFRSLGYDVKRLDRTAYAGLRAGKLRRGEWRYATSKEVEQLMLTSSGL